MILLHLNPDSKSSQLSGAASVTVLQSTGPKRNISAPMMLLNRHSATPTLLISYFSHPCSWIKVFNMAVYDTVMELPVSKMLKCGGGGGLIRPWARSWGRDPLYITGELQPLHLDLPSTVHLELANCLACSIWPQTKLAILQPSLSCPLLFYYSTFGAMHK